MTIKGTYRAACWGVLLAAMTVAVPQAQAAAKNKVTSIDVRADGEARAIAIRTTTRPTFTVFRLSDPMRIVVDVSGASVSGVDAPLVIEDGVVDRIAVRQFNSGGFHIGRVTVGFLKTVAYDVQAEGNTVVIRTSEGPDAPVRRVIPPPVAPVDRAAAERFEKAKAEAEQARERASRERAQAQEAASEAQKQKDEAQRLTEEAIALAREAEQAKQEASRLRNQAQEAAARDQQKAKRIAAQAEARLARAQAEAEQLERARAEAQRAAILAQQAQREAEESAARAEAEHKQRLAQLQQVMAKATKEKSEAREAWEKASAAQQEAEQAQRAAREAQKAAQKARQEAERRLEREKERHASAEKALRSLAAEKQMLAQERKKVAKAQAKLAEERARQESLRKTYEAKIARYSAQEAQRERELERERIRLQKLREAIESERKALKAQKQNTSTLVRKSAPSSPKLASVSPVIATQPPSRLTGVQHSPSSRDELLLKLDGDANYAVQTVEDPPRLVIDLTNTRRATARESYPVRTNFATKVRFGKHGNNLRAVLDLKNSSDVPLVQRDTHGLRVALKTAATPPLQTASSIEEISDVKFQSTETGARIILTVGDGVTTEVDDRSSKSWVLKLDGARIKKALERSLDTTAYDSVVRMVSSYQPKKDEPLVHVVANLRGKASYDLSRRGDELIWDIHGKNNPVAKVSRSNTAGFATQAANVSRSVVVRERRRQRFSIDLKDAEVVNVIRLIADISGENIITSDDVRGKITLRLRNVPWDKALDTILKTKGFAKVREHNIIRIAPADKIQQEREQALARKRAREAVEETVTRLIAVNYAVASQVVAQLQPLLSARGQAQVDERTNTIILNDLPENVRQVQRLARQLDRQTPQVLIEARIVEATDSFQQELGVQWGGTGRMTARNGNPTGLIFPSDVQASGAADDTTTITSGTGNPGRFAVNLPAPVGGGSGGGIGFIFGSATGSQILNLRLTALEQSGSGRIISSPRVTTLDNTKAVISQGVDIPIQVVSAAGANTKFTQARLELEVTPHVTNDGSILMKIRAKKDEPDFSRPGASGDPSLTRKNAETEVLVADGDTTVIGGIYTRRTTKATAAVPFFSKIPLLGWLFKNTSEVDERGELLIFITPKIINREKSLVQAVVDPNSANAPKSPSEEGGDG